MVFELVTGDFLFEPRKGPQYTKTDDQLAQMMELMGPMPKQFAKAGKQYRQFFKEEDSHTTFRRIEGLKFCSLERLLKEKYRMKAGEAKMLAGFMDPMLEWFPHKRATAQEMLAHPWLDMPADYGY